MTRKLYLEDSYQKEFDAKVAAVNGNQVILDQTYFYAAAGGQPGDTGEISGVKVSDTIKGPDGNVVHVLEKEPEFKVGGSVHGIINWGRRHRIMRLHTACHIISGVVYQKFNGAKFTGSQIYEDRARMDFDIEKFDEETAKIVETGSNKIIESDMPVAAKMLDWEEAEKDADLFRVQHELYSKYDKPRIVSIGNFDKQLDGGTHVKSTKEVGTIRIVKRENKGKHNKRITIVVE